MQSKHTKITYVGGWISLFLLLIMCLSWVVQSKHLRRSSAIEAYLFDNWEKEKYGYYPWKRNFRQIVLDDNEQENNKKFVIIYYRLKQLKANRDTINGIDIVFGKKCKFKDWVKTFDFFIRIKQRSYVAISNHVYLFHIEDKPHTNQELSYRDNSQWETVIYRYPEVKLDRWKITVNYFWEVVEAIKKYPLIFGLWLVLGFISVRKILKSV